MKKLSVSTMTPTRAGLVKDQSTSLSGSGDIVENARHR
jgi:hypothetical protein